MAFFSLIDLTCCAKMRPVHNVTHDSHGCVSSALANAVSFLKWLQQRSNSSKNCPCHEKMQNNVAAPGWCTDPAPTALVTLGKAAWAGIFLDRSFHAAIHTCPRTLGIYDKRFIYSMGAGLRSGGHWQQQLVIVQGSGSSQSFFLPLCICPSFIFSLPLFP